MQIKEMISFHYQLAMHCIFHPLFHIDDIIN